MGLCKGLRQTWNTDDEVVIEAYRGKFAWTGDPPTSGGVIEQGTAASPLTLTNANHILSIFTTHSATTGTVRSAEITQEQTVADASVINEVLYVNFDSSVMTGDWANAIVGRINYDATGNANGGMAAAICSEMSLPAATQSGGAYYSMDIELDCPTNFTCAGNTATPVAMLKFGLWGNSTAVASYEDEGYLIDIDGFTAGAGNIVSAGDNTLRILVGTTDKYIVLSDAENVIDIDAAGATLVNLGACTNGVVITAATTYGIDIQTSGLFRMGTMDDGIPVVSGYPFAMEVHTEPTTTLVAGDTGLSAGIRSRYHVSVAQSNQISISAVEARLRVKHALADGVHSAVSGVIEASTTNADFTGTATTQRCAGFFALDFDANVTLADDGWLTGVTINSSVNGSVSMSAVQFAGLRISTNSGKEVWETGIVIDDNATTTGIDVGICTTGIEIGACVTGIDSSAKARFGSSPGASGIQLTGTDPDYVLQSHAKVTTDLAAGAYAASYDSLTITANQTKNTSYFATWGELYITGDITLTNSNHGAVWGNLEMADAGGSLTTQGGDSWMGALIATIISPDGLVNNSFMAGVVIDSCVTTGYTNNGVMAAIGIRKSGSSAAWPYGLYAKEGSVTGDIKVQQEDANDLPCVIFSGTATNDGGIVSDIGSDTLWADGSLYISVVDGAGKLFQKQNDVWVDIA